MDPVDVANELRPLLLKLSRRLRGELHNLDVTASQVSLLGEIRQRPEIGITELAERERVSTPRMSKAVDRLVLLGLAERRPGTDRRRVGVAITPRGRSVLRSVKKRRTAWLAGRLRCLDAQELERVEAALPALQRLLEET